MKQQGRGGGLQPPKQGRPQQRRDLKKKKDVKKHADTEAHAQEVREVIRGRDIVERPTKQATLREQKPPAFARADIIVVRTWLAQRPLEPPISATALVAFPRMWSTRRGRYCRFNAPGAGAYGIVRARPSF
jgi:hypothetical protein